MDEDWRNPDWDTPEWDEPRPLGLGDLDLETINGAWRSNDGRFWQLPERVFLADGREEHDPRRYLALRNDFETRCELARSVSPAVALQAVRDLRASIDELEHEAVAIARGLYWSWRDIGDALGVSRSAAHRRFAREDVPPRQRRREPGGGREALRDLDKAGGR